MASSIYDEMRRRGVLRVAAVYIIAAWLTIQVADVFFPAWNVPEQAKQYLLLAAILGFPIAMVFGWLYDITPQGILRTPPSGLEEADASARLRHGDRITLAALAIAAAMIIFSVTGNIIETADDLAVVDTVSDKPENSIAVLPFVNMSDDPRNEYFCDGISEEILHRLSDYRDMYVLARTSSFAFKNTDIEVGRLADVLGVRYLLQGAVRKVGNELRISAQLVDENNFQVWSKTFDRQMEGVFAIQSEIALAVAESLASTMAASHEPRDRRQPEIDAYQHFLLGREYLRARPPGFAEDAIRHFDAAIAADAQYAAPLAGKAMALLLAWRDIDAATTVVEEAVQLDANDPFVLAAHGLLLQSERKSEEAAVILRRALTLDPGIAGVSTWLYNALISTERVDEAFAVLERAQERDPLDPRLASNLATRYSSQGDFHRAEALYKRLLALPIPPHMAYSGLFGLYDHYGRFDESIAVGKEGILAYAALDADPQFLYASVAYAYGRLGMFDTARYWMDRAESGERVAVGVRMRRSYLYRLTGELHRVEEPIRIILDEQGVDLERLAPFFSHVVGAVRMVEGKYDEAIEILEATLPLGEPFQRDPLTIDFVQALAWCHQKVGNTQRSHELLAYLDKGIRASQERGFGRDPFSLSIQAQNYLLMGELERALDTLEIAIASGFRYHQVLLYDERWARVADDQRYQELLARMKADIDVQRQRVEEIDATDRFIERLDAMLTELAAN
ncbi:MAG: tetratricopeptide repeat protein [Woeseiaceae bacterium]|nr:tetratricopeptide repeat protein [Woeseiaceae bacterium]